MGMTEQEMIKNALINYGAMLPEWKVEIIAREAKYYSDWVTIVCRITKKRCRNLLFVGNCLSMRLEI